MYFHKRPQFSVHLPLLTYVEFQNFRMELDALMAMHHMYEEALDKLLPCVWNRFYNCILRTGNHIRNKKY
jgi:hypothetical protein